jgi:hypothetical protein
MFTGQLITNYVKVAGLKSKALASILQTTKVAVCKNKILASILQTL